MLLLLLLLLPLILKGLGELLFTHLFFLLPGHGCSPLLLCSYLLMLCRRCGPWAVRIACSGWWTNSDMNRVVSHNGALTSRNSRRGRQSYSGRLVRALDDLDALGGRREDLLVMVADV